MKSEDIADVARFALIIALGFLAFVTFIVAATIIGLMWVESSHCNCVHYPVGLYVLGLLGIFFIASIIHESLDVQPVFEGWMKNQREALIVGLIFIFVILLIII
ncbi:MAG: hypothetical protein HC850_02960 [Rhodomicrobium sp.]|nr:hypothetical protein [Rhodomicrobium sp.]